MVRPERDVVKDMHAGLAEYVIGGELALSLHWEGESVRRIRLHMAGDVCESECLSESAVQLKQALIRYESRMAPEWPDLPLDFSGLTEFQRAAIDALLEISPGTTRTYGELAARLGRPGGAQAVGRAMAANPFPVIYPCHRVIGAGGSMVGFSAAGGVEMKKYLLRLEGAAQQVLPFLDE